MDQCEKVSTYAAGLRSDHALGCHRCDRSVDRISSFDENPPPGFGG